MSNDLPEIISRNGSYMRIEPPESGRNTTKAARHAKMMAVKHGVTVACNLHGTDLVARPNSNIMDVVQNHQLRGFAADESEFVEHTIDEV